MKYIVGLLVVAVISLGLYTFISPVKEVVSNTVGAVTGPDSFFPCETHNGVGRCFNRTTLRTATTTVCAIKSPAATSTLVTNSIQLTTSTTTAYATTIAKAATAFATTTVLGNSVTYSGGAQSTQVASSTAANFTAKDFTFGPSQWLVVGMQGSGGTFSPVGTCEATFEIN